MMVPVQAACNTILYKAFKEQINVTPMKLQKLLYFSNRDYLRKTGQSLFNERFEPWPYGPVLPSVYEEFKSFHGNPITMFAKNADGSASILSEGGMPDAYESIARVWSQYKLYSGIALSQLTHMEGSAWRKARDSGLSFLKDDDIKREDIS